MKDGFLRVFAISPHLRVADCGHNSEALKEAICGAAEQDASLVVFPELSLTAYTCGDLFLQKVLLDRARKELLKLAETTEDLELVAVLGLPLIAGGEIYNCAAVLHKGQILGVVPKSRVPTAARAHEVGIFSPGFKNSCREIDLGGKKIPFGMDLLFACLECPDFVLGVEFGSDLNRSLSPALGLTQAGATIIANSAANHEIAGGAEKRRFLLQSQSTRTMSAYIYACAGRGESSTDLVFSGHNLIAENGKILAEAPPFGDGIASADLDLDLIVQERRKAGFFEPGSFYDSANPGDFPFVKREIFRRIPFSLGTKRLVLQRKIDPSPFIPPDKNKLASRCEEVFSIQVAGLKQRLESSKTRCGVLGLSGGVDSTLALLVAVRAFDELDRKRSDIVCVTLPCFGTTDRTLNNASELAAALEVNFRTIRIAEAINQHFKDIDQNPEKHDAAYENAQARERTQVLMDIANQVGGLVIGTGDLSEASLGWTTYNGDHISMYAVNASVPKTLIREMLTHFAAASVPELKTVLLDIVNTPISPELLPPDKNSGITQKTEDLVGPYELHDFFLYYLRHYGFSPSKIRRMALQAFANKHSEEIIDKWLRVFYRRFFSQQFKRSCSADGPKVGSVSLSPRGDWAMPSDAEVDVWLADLNG